MFTIRFVSYHEWPSRITALKEVVNQFIRNTATSSPESNIGLAPFNIAVTNATNTLLNVDTNKNELIKNVGRLSVTGGTSPHTALNKALELLNNAKNPKYVILFTDGEPTGDGNVWDDDYQDYAEKAAKALKDKGIKVFQCPVKDPHRIHLLKICQLSGSLHFDPAIGKSMEHCPHGTWHSRFSPGRNARNYDWAASSVFFSCIDIFCFCFVSSRNADLFHAGTPVGNPLQDLMICTDDHFRSLIAPDIISVFFLFYTWLSQSQ